ncbi:MAG: DNA gyrase inhibitor YacG [Hyphomicrobium sp.]|nr:MAG: DNA gyrase inhibitor YacG [Hyphomicrobium sp.]PPC98913.1 MAG: DNA gyrase inhibitor YacG [Hyphomicrobium sp.]
MSESDIKSKPRRCPICSDVTTDEIYRPFCSRRCADVDLGRWLTGSYAIPGDANDDEANEPSALPPDNDDQKPH